MWGILICLVIITLSLLIIALKPAPQLSVSNPPYLPPRDEVIQLGSDRIAVIDVSHDSATHGRIAVFDFDNKNGTFKLVGEFDYSKDFRYQQPSEPTPTNTSTPIPTP